MSADVLTLPVNRLLAWGFLLMMVVCPGLLFLFVFCPQRFTSLDLPRLMALAIGMTSPVVLSNLLFLFVSFRDEFPVGGPKLDEKESEFNFTGLVLVAVAMSAPALYLPSFGRLFVTFGPRLGVLGIVLVNAAVLAVAYFGRGLTAKDCPTHEAGAKGKP